MSRAATQSVVGALRVWYQLEQKWDAVEGKIIPAMMPLFHRIVVLHERGLLVPEIAAIFDQETRIGIDSFNVVESVAVEVLIEESNGAS